MDANQTKNLIRTYTDAVWNQGNIEAMDRFYTSDYRHHDASQPDLSTLADYRGWAEALLSGVGDLKVEIQDVITEPPHKAVKLWTATGRHSGNLAGVPPTGRPIRFSGVTTYRLENGKIAESWYVYDLFGLLQQIGAIPSAEQAQPA